MRNPLCCSFSCVRNPSLKHFHPWTKVLLGPLHTPKLVAPGTLLSFDSNQLPSNFTLQNVLTTNKILSAKPGTITISSKISLRHFNLLEEKFLKQAPSRTVSTRQFLPLPRAREPLSPTKSDRKFPCTQGSFHSLILFPFPIWNWTWSRSKLLLEINLFQIHGSLDLGR